MRFILQYVNYVHFVHTLKDDFWGLSPKINPIASSEHQKMLQSAKFPFNPRTCYGDIPPGGGGVPVPSLP